MFQRLVIKHCQHHGDRDAVVGAERRSVSMQFITVKDKADRLRCQISCNAAVFLENHVHVSLQDDRRVITAVRGTFLEDDHIAGLVLHIFESAVFCEGNQIVAELFRVA